MLIRNSLKSKIVLYFIVFTTIPLLLSSSWILYEMYKSKEESVFNKHLQLLKIVQNESDSIVSNIEYLGEYIRVNYPIQKHQLITSLIQAEGKLSTILVLDKNGILTDFTSNINNKNLFKGFDYSYTEHFLKVKNTSSTYWSDVYLSNISHKPEISYTVKINSEYFAVLIIDLSVLNDFAKKFKSEDGSTMVRIMDKNGIFLAHPDRPNFIAQRKSIKNSNLYKKHMSKNHLYKQIKFKGIEVDNQIGVYGKTKKLQWNIILRESYTFLFKSFNNLLLFIGLFIVLLISLSIYFSIKLFKSILKPLDIVTTNMKNMAQDKSCEVVAKTEYSELDNLLESFIFMQEKIKNREKKIFSEMEKNREKDIKIYEQSKLASMGEMIGNIAHQWRQPLSIISTASTGMKMQRKFNMLSDDKVDDTCEIINTQTQYLSKTIDDFKDFVKGERVLLDYDLKECMESFIELITPSAKNNNLNLILNFEEDIKLEGYPNELKQCLINIFNNSKDVVVDLADEDKLLFISAKKDNDSVSINIKDSGGGIPENILLKIYDPYFTTKHQSKGTGLGLHMAYNLIVEGMKGSIAASNVKFKYNNKEYKGANFKILLPLK
jgi:signal transduction histidine kinase